MMEEKRTLVLGASPKVERFSNQAVVKLKKHNIPVFAVGLREGEIDGVKIEKPFPDLHGIHTITLYVGAKNQPFYYDFILRLNPRRVIINPGAESDEFEKLLTEKGIDVIRGCTLIMLSKGTF